MIIYWILLIGIICLSFFISFFVLVKLFISPSYNNKLIDVGIRKVDERTGRTIVYRVENKAKEYVDQYILSSRNNNNVLKCKLKQDIESIDYDVVVYNKRNKVCSILNVYEDIIEDGYTRLVDLPKETSHITLILNKVNKKDVNKLKIQYLSKNRIVLYCICCYLVLILGLIGSLYCVSTIFGDVFFQSFLKSFQGIVVISIFSLILIAVNSVLIYKTIIKKVR